MNEAHSSQDESGNEKRWTISVQSEETGEFEQYDKHGEKLDDAKDAAVEEATSIHGPFHGESVRAVKAGGPYDE